MANETNWFRTGSQAVHLEGKNGNFCHIWTTAFFKGHVLRGQKSRTESMDTTSEQMPVENPLKSG